MIESLDPHSPFREANNLRKCLNMRKLLASCRSILMLRALRVPEVWLRSQQPVSERVWRERCSKHDLALNDCNWCRCGSNRQYVCTARVCSTVDMFGHFNDAIQSMDVGMQGHGAWRSKGTACEPGVHYQKNELLCVCHADGKWPNAVCRDVFQVLHTVIPTKYTNANNQSCVPGNLYQIDCNVCLCGSNAQIDQNACTKRNCTNDISEIVKDVSDSNNYAVDEIYAVCERAKAYQIGCKTCVCLPNNRLLCDNCTSITNVKNKVKLKGNNNVNLCSNKTPGKYFKKECNICYCDIKDVLYCTALKCLENRNDKISVPSTEFEKVEPPVDDNDCVPGTTYKRDCNTCHCFKFNGVKYFGCTLKKCSGNKLVQTEDSCVVSTKYEKNCLICDCVKEEDELKEICTFNEECKIEKRNPRTKEDETSLDVLHGYCEPLHVYKQDCNKCRCLSDGKTLACTSKICSSKLEFPKAIVAEFIPFIQKGNVCPEGHRYKVDCNFCQCLSNGNALCTTKTCAGRSRT